MKLLVILLVEALEGFEGFERVREGVVSPYAHITLSTCIHISLCPPVSTPLCCAHVIQLHLVLCMRRKKNHSGPEMS